MAQVLAFFQFGELGFYLLVLALIAVVVFYLINRKQQQ
jgi:preprotein translocase subunit YajC